MCSYAQPVVAFRNGFRALKRCPRCGARYVDPPRSPEEISAHFSAAFSGGRERVQKGFEKNRHRVLLQVAKYIHARKGGGRILDVGCGGGYFLERFFRVPPWELWGLEISTEAAARAADKGIAVQIGDLHSANFPEQFFDIVTVLDALYYFPNPRQELRDIRRVLKPGALVLLELPLAQLHIWRTRSGLGGLLGEPVQPLVDSHHNFFYTPKSTSFLLEESGFNVEGIMPLAANEQGWRSHDVLYRLYSFASSLLWRLSNSKLVIGPRFLAVGCKS